MLSIFSFCIFFAPVAILTPRLHAGEDSRGRIDGILRALFIATFHRTTRSLLHQDWIAFALALAQIFLSLADDACNEDWDVLFGRRIERRDGPDEDAWVLHGISDEQRRRLARVIEVLAI
jgi:hypothetical protein